jgi:transposase InsO family protein
MSAESARKARNLGLDLTDQGIRFLVRDRDSKYSGPLDEVFRSEQIRIVKTPIRAPKANEIAERFVRTVRAECLDWLPIVNRRHLERVLRTYVHHYNTQRPHRALKLQPPEGLDDQLAAARSSDAQLNHRQPFPNVGVQIERPPIVLSTSRSWLRIR